MNPLSRESVIEVLRKVQDPELARDIVSLGMVQKVEVNGRDVSVALSIVSQSEKLRESIKEQVEQVLRAEISDLGSLSIQAHKPSKAEAPFQPKQGIPGVQHIIAVASGKGGVGKSTVAVNLALALKQAGHRVGLMDGDIYGPNIPLMLGVDAAVRPRVNDKERIIPIEALGIKMISMGVLVPPDQPMVWRGPMLHSAVTQFLQQVDWGELDYLLIDLPPGTGDVQLSLVQTTPLSGAVIVTTPQEVALMDVRKGIAMFAKTEVPILGVIENMSGDVFGRGGGRQAAEQFQVSFLGEIPLDAKIREGGDSGKPIVESDRDSAVAIEFRQAIDRMSQVLEKAGV